MSDIFISYARSTEVRAQQIAEVLRGLGYGVWRDDELPAHRDYSEVIEERLRAAKAVVVVWSAEAVKSQWVRAEAEIAREAGTLVQLSLDGAALPLPFNRIQFANLTGWTGDVEAPGWRKVAASIAELAGRAAAAPSPAAAPPSPVARASARAPTDLPTIAVAPFVALSGRPEEADFADGMTDELLTALSRFPHVLVIGGTLSGGVRGAGRSARDMAGELGARFIVDGGVRSAGERVRISVKLFDSASGGQIWAEQFDGRTDDIFALQGQVAVSAAAQIAPAMETAYLSRALALPADELSAYELFLRAVHLEREFSRQALEEAVAAVDLALERDPHFAMALAFSSQLRALLVLNGWADDPAEMTRAALELGRRAVNRATEDPSVLANVATVLIWVGDDARSADAMVERALARHPGSPLPWFASAWIKVFDGRPALALEQWETHLRLSPQTSLYAFVAGGAGVALTLLKRFEEAVGRLREALHIVPEQRIFGATLVAALAHSGQQVEACELLGQVPPVVLARLLGLLRRDEDRALIAEGLRRAGAKV